MDFVLYCKLELGTAVPDYGTGSTCVLLTGVRQEDFAESAFDKGVQAYIIEADIDLSTLGFCNDEECACRTKLREVWIKLTLASDNNGQTWVYRAFAGGPPEKFNVLNIEIVSGPQLPDFPDSEDVEFEGGASTPYSLSGFEVGQGMASLVYNSSFGYLADAGAGTPIKRPAYLLTSFVSDLLALLNTRTNKFFLSHADSDHWRMLVWDGRIETRVSEFFVPSGMKPLVFFDVTVKSRTRRWSAPHVSVPLYSGQKLQIMRTAPAHPTSNNDGLILLFEDGAELGLLPGDCVYDEIVADANAHVNSLAGKSYTAIVVPHHGDAASAHGVPPSSAASKAFFSAGNHTTYLHPTLASTNAHSLAGYTNLVNKTPAYIREVPLM
ncbi:hypothetical protein EFV37_20945 [Mesorhizobium loti]|uniref:Uncharacterized protein n=1 Tax=Mesorhizobium jarvisii TaxID=1777867 RepID=A0A6M7TJG7_9HYPH|nr:MULTISPECIES: hypothetical protein [Mesorhizobium]OBQ64325.1 hypothetical protein A9K72_17640 [Mesorhizobium loti]QKC64476.1 hypothetical protein EB229_20940 [Mesorhizobium jarvisii]QKD10390.1 hypothetical protein EFV37_20945 [Mesorhizobium loti]RJT37031.1 hypothetical protein D3242_06905 [Mesorhizobium jarvisii]